MKRYELSPFFINNSEQYKDFFEQKNNKNPSQYYTFNFKNLSKVYEANLDVTIHVVEPSDKLYMISQKYYNDPSYGWIICYTNKKSSELEISTGDVLNIYFPLEQLLELFNGRAY